MSDSFSFQYKSLTYKIKTTNLVAYSWVHQDLPQPVWLITSIKKFFFNCFCKCIMHKSISHPDSWLEVWEQSHCSFHLYSSGPVQSTSAPRKHPFPSASLWWMASSAGGFWKNISIAGKFIHKLKKKKVKNTKKILWPRLHKKVACGVQFPCQAFIHMSGHYFQFDGNSLIQHKQLCFQHLTRKKGQKQMSSQSQKYLVTLQ